MLGLFLWLSCLVFVVLMHGYTFSVFVVGTLMCEFVRNMYAITGVPKGCKTLYILKIQIPVFNWDGH